MTLLAYWPVATGSWLLILLIACCVVVMGLMMWLMMRWIGSSTDSSPKDTNKITAPRGEVEGRRGQQLGDPRQRESPHKNTH
jgi:hypothetical protein